ncbi:hypothetical protein J6590_036231 [Homalodisca vitripennis]|nr:hypothetical protein J6590_036231 [Homalodisca vitripennis]
MRTTDLEGWMCIERNLAFLRQKIEDLIDEIVTLAMMANVLGHHTKMLTSLGDIYRIFISEDVLARMDQSAALARTFARHYTVGVFISGHTSQYIVYT